MSEPIVLGFATFGMMFGSSILALMFLFAISLSGGGNFRINKDAHKKVKLPKPGGSGGTLRDEGDE